MPEPVFTRREMRALTFEEDDYLQGLAEKAAKIAGMLRLGHEEAGILDRKLSPDLLHTVAQIIQFLDDPDYREEAEHELVRQDDPDLAIAILRQAFRIRSDRVNDLLVRKLTDLCRAEGGYVAREAIREATGSELQRLSQLADEVFLNVGNLPELLQVAADSQRALPIRVRACYLLLEHHAHYPAVPVALKLFSDGAKIPTTYELLRRLSNAFGAFELLVGRRQL